VEDPVSRINPSAPLVPLAQLPGALDSKNKESNDIRQQPESTSCMGDLAGYIPKRGKKDYETTNMDGDMGGTREAKMARSRKECKELSTRERSKLERIIGLDRNSNIGDTQEGTKAITVRE
jgi:hypothetical protein